MNDLFNNQNIYPHEGKIIQHFGEFYESAFISFLPFFQDVNTVPENENFKKSEKITFQQAQKELDFLKNIEKPNATIFSYSNDNYPSDEEIYKNGTIVTWTKIIAGSNFQEYSEINKALCTSICAVKKVFRRHDLETKLNQFTSKEKIWHPNEGHFDVFSKASIYKAFKLLNKNEIVIVDEFYETTKTIFITNLNEWEFVLQIQSQDYYIYSEDKELLFTIDWDSFFFIIASSNKNIEKIISAQLFEGFVCDSKTEHEWDYEEGEVEKLLQLAESEEQKKWWQFWK